MNNIIFDLTCYLILVFGILSRIIHDYFSGNIPLESITVITFVFIVIGLTAYYQVYQPYLIFGNSENLPFSRIRKILVDGLTPNYDDNDNENNKNITYIALQIILTLGLHGVVQIILTLGLLLLVSGIALIIYYNLYKIVYIGELLISQIVYFIVYFILMIYSITMKLIELGYDIVGEITSNNIFKKYMILDGKADLSAKDHLASGLKGGLISALISIVMFTVKIIYIFIFMMTIGIFILLWYLIKKGIFNIIKVVIILLMNCIALLYQVVVLTCINLLNIVKIFNGSNIDVNNDISQSILEWIDGHKILDTITNYLFQMNMLDGEDSLISNNSILKRTKQAAYLKSLNFLSEVYIDGIESLPTTFYKSYISEIIINNNLAQLLTKYSDNTKFNQFELVIMLLYVSIGSFAYMYLFLFVYNKYKDIIEKTLELDDDYSNTNKKNFILIIYIIIYIKMYMLRYMFLDYLSKFFK